ncbi:hypothetical protein ABK040_000651 [Willaertia magna]
MGYDLKIVSGSANQTLSEDVCRYLDLKSCKSTKSQFADGECNVQVSENVRGSDAFIIQPLSGENGVNNSLMELLLMVDALKRASASRITAVIPYYAYARQDRKTKSRVPISAALVAKMLETSGVDHVLSVDLHAGQIQGFFSIPVDNISAKSFIFPVLLKNVTDLSTNLTIVSPDAGGAGRADSFLSFIHQEYKQFNAELAVMNKWKVGSSSTTVNCWNDWKAIALDGDENGKTEDHQNGNGHTIVENEVLSPWVMELVGNVKGRDCIIVDDLIDTAGTLCSAAKCLKEQGANRIFACVTHALMKGPALDRIENTKEMDLLVVTDTIKQTQKVIDCKKIAIVNVGELIGEAVRRIHNEESLVNHNFL